MDDLSNTVLGSITKSSSKTIQYESQGSAHDSEWIYWGTIIESCGTGTELDIVGNDDITLAYGDGKPKSVANVCSRTPLLAGGELAFMHAQRKSSSSTSFGTDTRTKMGLESSRTFFYFVHP